MECPADPDSECTRDLVAGQHGGVIEEQVEPVTFFGMKKDYLAHEVGNITDLPPPPPGRPKYNRTECPYQMHSISSICASK